MRQLSIFRLAILILMRDLLIPGGGLFLAVYLPVQGILAPWHLPLIAGMLGTPLVARGGVPADELEEQVQVNPPQEVLKVPTEALPPTPQEELK